ncbi:NTP transferase domain-containing protein [Tsukamurella sp. 8F]|uniref:NTP transferase domain-containing protein n=1 Tax=unclassified Tsukamurella TaxID=2633480 RepID=UPI0023B9214E|nr:MULTISPECIES: NTP transferase domain-containing protein [unclassified Tsukamurella]MDF0528721.1 NTP transferase domain-containing protein [Tsukamurella sp. 8J]MDF0585683.1 NTP transferase domain-containing protein [Tsukamurella sp. 8F]
MTQLPVHAIVLAGGAARRLGADKPEQRVGGRRLLDIALNAVSGAEAIVVVGPPRDVPDGVRIVRETPAGAGPVAAIAAGFSALPAGSAEVVVLASDLPGITADEVARLVAARGTAPVALACDDRPQYLTAVWDSAALARALSGVPPRMRDLVPHDAVLVPSAGAADVDTPEQLEAARLQAAATPYGARAAIRDSIAPLPPRRAALEVGAVLAEPLTAAAPFPPYDASAMDGWAVAGQGPWVPDGGPVAAGADAGALVPGHARRIATGARLPDGAARVIRDEEVSYASEVLRQNGSGPEDRDDTRRRGESWRPGDVLIPAGAPVTDVVVSVARSARVERAAIRGPVRITVYTSGDEIDRGGTAPDRIPETASGPVVAVLARTGARVTIGSHLADDPAALDSALAEDSDVIAVIGATGRGVADHLRSATARAGGTPVVEKVAVRPGGSVLVATLGTRVLLGLGGNPLAALSAAALLGPAIVDALTAATARTRDLVPITGLSHADRWRIVPAEPDGAGHWVAHPHTPTGHLLAAAGHRGLLLVPPNTPDGALAERLA